MANICSNNIEFIGKEEDLDNLFKHLDKTVKLRNKGVNCAFILFPDNTPILKWMSDLSYNDEESIYFSSAWGPDPVQIIRIANYFNLSFIYGYEELGSDIYGEFKYDHITKELTDRCLTGEEQEECKRCGKFDKHPSDCHGPTCENSEYDYEQMNIILETKDFSIVRYSLETGDYNV